MEQRSSYRIPFEDNVHFGYLNRPFDEGILLNISEKGIAIKAQNALPENAPVTVIIYCLNNRPIKIDGEVKRVTEYQFSDEFEMGISITNDNTEFSSIYFSMLNRGI